MPTHSSDCPICHRTVQYWEVHCRCGHFNGFPNHRAAAIEREDQRYEAARHDAEKRGVAPLLAKIEALAEQSRPVIAMDFAACDDILRSDKYRNYGQRVESHERQPAGAQNHADRGIVGERLFPMYARYVHYAVLSPNGRGLLPYGPVAVTWDVTPVYLGRRASLLDENSYSFFDRHALGHREKSIPVGHRATWEDRAKLVAAKLAARLTPATGEAILPSMLLQGGATRDQDEFVEIAIYADDGLDTQDVSMVTLQRAARTPEEQYRCELVREIAVSGALP